METGTYSVGHVCCISRSDMKMNHEHTDKMHGEGYVSLLKMAFCASLPTDRADYSLLF